MFICLLFLKLLQDDDGVDHRFTIVSLLIFFEFIEIQRALNTSPGD